jgi:hypothetical protein
VFQSAIQNVKTEKKHSLLAPHGLTDATTAPASPADLSNANHKHASMQTKTFHVPHQDTYENSSKKNGNAADLTNASVINQLVQSAFFSAVTPKFMKFLKSPVTAVLHLNANVSHVLLNLAQEMNRLKSPDSTAVAMSINVSRKDVPMKVNFMPLELRSILKTVKHALANLLKILFATSKLARMPRQNALTDEIQSLSPLTVALLGYADAIATVS